jgi:hypothetical protein
MQRGEISKQPEDDLEDGSRASRSTANHSGKTEGGDSGRKDASSVAEHITERDDFFGEDYSEDGSEVSDHDAPGMENSYQDE